MNKNDWNPENYLQFKNERTQPSIDLVNRINLCGPKTIIDIGCGPGNSTDILKAKWPQARIKGIDNSPAMIQKAKEIYPGQEWEIKDVKEINTKERYDLVFSNAVIQWIPDHEFIIDKLVNLTESNGVLAIQMPLYHEMPISSIIDNTYKVFFPHSSFNISEILTFNSSTFYFDLLCKRSQSLEMWETSYFHIMDSEDQIYEMIKTTGLKPYLESIESDIDKECFIKHVKSGILETYKTESSGNVIFPFKRMFAVAYI